MQVMEILHLVSSGSSGESNRIQAELTKLKWVCALFNLCIEARFVLNTRNIIIRNWFWQASEAELMVVDKGAFELVDRMVGVGRRRSKIQGSRARISKDLGDYLLLIDLEIRARFKPNFLVRVRIWADAVVNGASRLHQALAL